MYRILNFIVAPIGDFNSGWPPQGQCKHYILLRLQLKQSLPSRHPQAVVAQELGLQDLLQISA